MTTIKKEQCSLPPEKVFSIQIGTELFRLSGASIASDAPSYFSQFFEAQINQNGGDASSLRTLYIDRDPGTFQEIARHLQGYHVRPKDSTQFVKLFADAQFYSLPRLTSQLFESDIFVQIGGRQFQIPRDIFSSPGDSPNFFSLGFADFFASPSEVFPGLDRTGLLRPPAIEPPSVPNRSGDVFAELLHMLRGYPLEIRSEEHREQLLRDCRYYHLRGLEQRLIPHDISFNSSSERTEIVIRLEDLQQSGLDVIRLGTFSAAWLLTYARPFTNEKPHDLLVEIGGETTIINYAMKAEFLGTTRERVMNLIRLVADKTPLPTENKELEDLIETCITKHTDLTVDGQSADPTTIRIYTSLSKVQSIPPSKKRLRIDEAEAMQWNVRTGQWRIVVAKDSDPQADLRVRLVAVKLDVYAKERERNRARGFLTR